MSDYEDIDEELRRIMDAGSASAEPGELAELRAQLAAQPDTSGDMPKGTRVAFDEDLEVSAPVRKPITPRAAAPLVAETPKTVDLSAESPDDMELAAARVEDRMARSKEAFERGSRQLVAGLTRTDAVQSTPGPMDAVKSLYARRKDADARTHQQNQERAAAGKIDFDTKESARKAALDQTRYDEGRKTDAEKEAWRREEAARDNTRSAEGNASRDRNTNAILGLRMDEAATKKTDRGDRAAAGAIPLFGGTLQTPPGLSDTERNQARTQAGLWNAADEATGQLEDALKAYVASPGPETAQNITALLGSASTALNTAYGQGAMAEAEARRMADTLGADIRSIGGIKALFDRAMGNPDAGHLLLSKIKTARAGNRATALARLKTSGAFSEGGASAPQAARPTATSPDGQKVEWDGSAWVPVR